MHLLLGFVFSMVFGHAPIVLPAVARLRLPYHPVLYLPLARAAVESGLAPAGRPELDDFALRQQAALGQCGGPAAVCTDGCQPAAECEVSAEKLILDQAELEESPPCPAFDIVCS